MKLVLEVTIEGLPPIISNGAHRHWRVAAGIRRAWVTRAMAHFLKHKPREPYKKAKLTLTRASSRQPDYDGLVISMKPIIDALKQAGIIYDDGPNIIGQPEYRWERVGRRAGFVRVRVEALEN